MHTHNDNPIDFPIHAGDTLNRLRALFESLMDLPADARARWLATEAVDADECAALMRLLAAHDGTGFLDTPMVSHASRLDANEAVSAEGLIGTDIGGYRILQMLGRGGMSAVFLAERSGKDFHQQVAFKLLRRGLYSELEQRLFQRERQVLATLDHPNIARLIDGGVTDAGIPYLVMEYVDGMPITRYAQACNLALRERLGLFLATCRAVEAAHHRLVVHRDIKPSNILVSLGGEVKLLDFGIAKLIEDDTDAPTIGVFTPGYAAPEQISGGTITTATDVYGLGVLLHDLLIGRKPEGDPLRRPSSLLTSNAVATAEVTAPALQRRVVRGDLDNIMLKALAVEPERRYASAGAFAQDIERYLDARPVKAHPPSRWYRAQKFVQRHRGGVAVTAALLLAVLASLALALWQAKVTRQEAQRANAMRDFIFTAFAEAEPSSPRSGPPNIAEVVEQAIAKTRDDTHMNSRARTELLTRLGEVLTVQGRLAPAQTVLQSNYTQAQQKFGADDALARAAGRAVMWNEVLKGEFDAARKLADQLLARTPAQEPEARLQLLRDSAMLASKQHDLKRAQAEASEAVQLSRILKDTDLLSGSLNDYGNVQLSVGDYAGAITTYNEVLSLQQAHFGSQHVLVAATHAALSRAYRHTGDLARSQEHAQAALAIDAAVLPPDDWRHALHLNALMMLQLEKRDYRGGLLTAQESLRIKRIALGEDHPDTLAEINNVGMAELHLEDYSAAVPLLRESLQRTETKFGERHYETAVSRINFGYAAAMSGAFGEGETQLRRGIADLHAVADPDPAEEASAIERLIRLELDQHDTHAALALFDPLIAAIAHITPVEASWTARLATVRGMAYLDSGDVAAARAQFSIADTAATQSSQTDAELRVEILLLEAKAAFAAKDMQAAKSLAGQAADAVAALSDIPTHLSTLAARVRGLAQAQNLK